jgi:hypothetical protein
MRQDEKVLRVLENADEGNEFIQISCYIDEEHETLLKELSLLLGKEQCLLVNEAIGVLIRKYQPKASTDFSRLRLMNREN